MYFYILPEWLKIKLLAISNQPMTFTSFSLFITAITFGVVMTIMFFNYAFKDKEGNVPIHINKILVILFSVPFVNIFTLCLSIFTLIFYMYIKGLDLIKEKFGE